MRLLLDTCVWGKAADDLRDDGHDVDWVGDWPVDPGDEEILARAHSEGRVDCRNGVADSFVFGGGKLRKETVTPAVLSSGASRIKRAGSAPGWLTLRVHPSVRTVCSRPSSFTVRGTLSLPP